LVNLKALLRLLVEKGGSDLHLIVGSPPLVRVDGLLRRAGSHVVTTEETQQVAESIISPERLEDLRTRQHADFAHSVPGVGRFRVNAFRQRGSISFVFRRVRLASSSFEELGLPGGVRTLADMQRGLVLVTGPTGSGKTTTLACMIDHINSTKPVHILTVEDPIEVLHAHKVAGINQREVGVDAPSFVEAMRAAMRQDPDVILIGEMRDTETVAAALSAAETGHLVLSTLHTNDAVETMNRIVDFFPPYQQHQVRSSLSSVLRGVISQRLVPRIGGGRVPAIEILFNNGRVAERILDPPLTSEINEIIAEGSYYGMQTFDQSLLSLASQGLVQLEDALEIASNPHDLELMFQQAGLSVA
jgi:twitching motility protein PilT